MPLVPRKTRAERAPLPLLLLLLCVIAPTASEAMSTTSVYLPAIHLMTLGVNISAICRLETLAALVLNDHAYDKLT